MNTRLLPLSIALALLAGCPSAADDDDSTPDGTPDLAALAAVRADRLTQWLAGEFNSVDQAAAQPSYLEIQVLGCPIDAPELGARVLYVEQAVMPDSLDAPYRQRVYVVQASDGDEVSASTTVYTLVDPDAAIGLCDTNDRPTFGPDDVTLRDGCGVNVAWDAASQSFAGGTDEDSCESTLNGATYATSEVEIRANGFDSWDRGYDDAGEQVWGAVDGAYEFDRR